MANEDQSRPGPVSIQEKIRIARELYERWGAALGRNEPIQQLLGSLREKARASSESMRELGVADECRRCDQEEGGSCCGAGIENRYTVTLLLMNLLLGGDLPDVRRYKDSCFFLGESGCRLKARHILCVNYLCLRIQKKLPPDDLIDLQNVAGEEMDMVFIIHEAIKKSLSQ